MPKARTVDAKLRQQILKRDFYTCQECAQVFRASELEIHHVIPRSNGGSDDPANLRTYCKRHHARMHRNYWPSESEQEIRRQWKQYVKELRHM